MEITAGTVTFVVFVFGALFSGFMWIWNMSKDKAVKDNITDTTLNNHTNAINVINALVKDVDSKSAKSKKKLEKKVFTQLQKGEDKFKKLDDQEHELRRINEEQTRFRLEIKEIRTDIKDIGRSTNATEKIVTGILQTLTIQTPK